LGRAELWLENVFKFRVLGWLGMNIWDPTSSEAALDDVCFLYLEQDFKAIKIFIIGLHLL